MEVATSTQRNTVDASKIHIRRAVVVENSLLVVYLAISNKVYSVNIVLVASSPSLKLSLDLDMWHVLIVAIYRVLLSIVDQRKVLLTSVTRQVLAPSSNFISTQAIVFSDGVVNRWEFKSWLR